MTDLARFERRYRADHVQEHGLLLDRFGKVVAEHTGDYDSVEFTPLELEAARGGVLSHSHPRDLPPSAPDVAVAATYGLTVRAIGIAPDTGEQFDHMVKVIVANTRQAEQIAADYLRAEEEAQHEIAKQPVGDLQWQRESRHIALQRIAQRYGFIYRRTHNNQPLSETRHSEKARLDVLTSVESVMRDRVFVPLHDEIMRNLSRLAVNGIVPTNQMEQARQTVSTIVQRTILGPASPSGSLHPYVVQRGEVIPRSPYFKVLWGLMREAGTAAAKGQADLMRKYLPPDLIRSLEYATVNAFDTNLSEMDEAPDLTGHDPLHMWTGPDGKRLLDRLWSVSADLYRRLDRFVTSAVARGENIQQIDKSLERFLVQDKGSYEAMRLARTETAATYSRVDSAAASLNPLVEFYQPFTSPAHNHIDICDEMVAGGPYPKSDTDHLSPYHPFCLCGVRWILVEDIPAAIAGLRSRIEQAIAYARKAFTDLIGPLSRRFMDVIFGGRS